MEGVQKRQGGGDEEEMMRKESVLMLVLPFQKVAKEVVVEVACCFLGEESECFGGERVSV